MTSCASLTRFAPAKVNLALAVAPPRAGDNLHSICSWIAPITLGDTLTITARSSASQTSHTIAWADDAPRPSPIDWPVEKDLAVRAHRALEAEAGRALPIELSLHKRTPVGAGLGGGSSDAAAALLAIRDLYKLPITDDRLRAIGLALGADVPVFLPSEPANRGGKPAIVEGVGERITRTPRVRGVTGAPQRLLLVMPDFGCPTGAVYRAFDAALPDRFRDDEVRRLAHRAVVEPDDLFNDLAPAAESVAPRLREIRDLVAGATGSPVHVTGSGSAMFVVLEDGESCDQFAAGACRAIEAAVPGVATRIVSLG